MNLKDLKFAFVVAEKGDYEGDILEAPEDYLISDNKKSLFKKLKLWGYEDLYKTKKIKLVTFEVKNINEHSPD